MQTTATSAETAVRVPVLDAQALTKIYGSAKSAVRYKALDAVSLNVYRAEFVGIMGPSGSGKTTLLNLLATIDQPTSGTISINGMNPSRMNKKELALFRRRQLGFVFQDFNLLDTLSIRENILLPLVLDQVKPEIQEQKLDELDDELTGNLDSKSAHDVMTALKDMNEQRGATILMVTHDPFAASFCKRVVFIKDGKLFSEIRRGEHRQVFFQHILDALSVLGGNFSEVSPSRD